MLQEEFEEEKDNPTSLTVIYLAWEAILHDDFENCNSYAKQALDILYNNPNDEFYMNYEYILGCYIYILQC